MTLIDLGQFGRARKALDYEMPSVTHVAARGALLSARIARLLGASPLAGLQRARAKLARGEDYYLGALLELERAETLEAAAALPVCEAVARAAGPREYGGIAVKARLLAARAALGVPAMPPRRPLAGASWSAAATLHAADCYPLAAAAIGIEILLAGGKSERAAASACRRPRLAARRPRCRRCPRRTGRVSYSAIRSTARCCAAEGRLR